MKARTKLQHEVLGLSRLLIPREDVITRWAGEKHLDHRGYMTKARVVCMDCGERFPPESVRRKRAVCPHCGAKLRIEESRRTSMKQHCYPAYAEVVQRQEGKGDAFQVIRYFELYAYHKAGERVRYFCHEIVQQWVQRNGKVEIVGLRHSLNWNCNCWGGDMEIRRDCRRGYYGQADRYDVLACGYHPESKFLPMYTRYGIDGKLQELTFLEAIREVPNNSKAETLLKVGWYGLLSHCNCTHWGKLERYWPSIKICLRRKYRPQCASIWLDYLDLLEYFNKDMRNAHYVCPKNLKTEHDRLMKQKLRRLKQEEKERKRRRAEEEEAAFKKFIGRFLGLEFGDKEIRVRPLESVDEFVQEGDAMHHCVFTNDYFKKHDRLILTARTQTGERMETVEVSLTTLKVVQCRGKFNQDTEYHDRIIRLVEQNRGKIAEKMNVST